MTTPTPHIGLSEWDYSLIEAAVMETVRGRWFLSEFARRNRMADTQTLLAALARIEKAAGLSAPPVESAPEPPPPATAPRAAPALAAPPAALPDPRLAAFRSFEALSVDARLGLFS